MAKFDQAPNTATGGKWGTVCTVNIMKSQGQIGSHSPSFTPPVVAFPTVEDTKRSAKSSGPVSCSGAAISTLGKLRKCWESGMILVKVEVKVANIWLKTGLRYVNIC